MITVSTSKLKKRDYHHGDLREAAIKAGLKLLESGTVDGVGLREVARAVGVSATALYRHFASKQQLLDALAARGLEQLAAAQMALRSDTDDPVTAFRDSGRAYVRFALDHPALFKLMFASAETTAYSAEPGNPALHLLRRDAAGLAEAEEASRDVVAVRAWALAHGLAVLMLGGQVPADASLTDAVLDGNQRVLGEIAATDGVIAQSRRRGAQGKSG